MGYDFGWNDPGILVSTGIADEVPVYTFLYDKSTSIDDPTVPPLDASVIVHPNPARDQSSLKYAVPKASNICLSTYNLKGQLIKSESFSGKGEKGVLDWSATNSAGIKLQNGVYLLRFESDGVSQTKRVVVCR